MRYEGLKIKVSLVVSLISICCSHQKSWIEVGWEPLALNQIDKCPVPWKKKKAIEMLEFGREKNIYSIIGKEFNYAKKIYIIQSSQQEQPNYSILINIAGDSIVYNFEYDKKIGSFLKSIVKRSEISPDFYKDLYANFPNGFNCDENSTDTELYLVLESK